MFHVEHLRSTRRLRVLRSNHCHGQRRRETHRARDRLSTFEILRGHAIPGESVPRGTLVASSFEWGLPSGHHKAADFAVEKSWHTYDPVRDGRDNP